jgi:hypothetical protein
MVATSPRACDVLVGKPPSLAAVHVQSPDRPAPQPQWNGLDGKEPGGHGGKLTRQGGCCPHSRVNP